MTAEMCPSCRQIRSMRVTTSFGPAPGAEGKTKRIRSLSFHFETCHQFVRSEVQEETIEAPQDS